MPTMDKRAGLCDMHCHILPGIDDGCRTVEDSLKQLELSVRQGIGRMFLTPHYYHRRSVEEFLAQRQAAWEQLCLAMEAEPADYPELKLGAEVAYFQGISYEDDIPLLCLGKSDFLLLEMPFVKWSPSVLRELEALQQNYGIRLVLAHLERYFKLQDKSVLDAVYDSGFLIQMNAEYVLGPFGKSKAKRLLKAGRVDLLGSDCHRPDTRPQNLGDAVHALRGLNLDAELRRIAQLDDIIFCREEQGILP